MKKLLISCLFLFTANTFAFDHTHKSFDQILKKYVSFKGQQSYVNYKAIKQSSLKELDTYLKVLSAVSKKQYEGFSKDQRLAFLINSYNAFTIKIIVKNYPLKSIKDIGSLFKSTWKIKFFKFLGKDESLDGIEHGIIRKNFNEPRIHFAVNCASIGCPPLLASAFTAKDLEEQLKKGELLFLTDKKKNSFKKGTLNISKIFKWYGGDFTKVHGSLEAYFSKRYGIKKSLIKDIDYTSYDWKLNESK